MAEVTNNEQNFEEMLEESLKFQYRRKGARRRCGHLSHRGLCGRRPQAGWVHPVSELSNDPSAKPEDLVKIGDEMDLLIMKTNDQEGVDTLSRVRFEAQKV